MTLHLQIGKGFIFKKYVCICEWPLTFWTVTRKGMGKLQEENCTFVRNFATNTNLENELIHFDNELSL